MQERKPHARGFDSGEGGDFDYAGDDLLALPWTEDDEEALLDSRLDRELHDDLERHRQEQEQREADYEREQVEGIDQEKLWRETREILSRPLPPSPEEREAEVEREHVPLTDQEAELLSGRWV